MSIKRMRLATLILVIIILAQGLAIYVQQREAARREAQLLTVLSLYRDRGTESILDGLDELAPLAIPDGSTLEGVLKLLKNKSKTASLPTGFPIYVDPVGLQEAEQTMRSPIKPPSTGPILTLRTQMQKILEPLGLTFVVKDGLFMITATSSADRLIDERVSRQDLYLRYRDLLR